jgi:hypothetical protein
MKIIKNYKNFLNEELKILKGPTDEETDEVYNEMEPEKALYWSIKNDLPDYVIRSLDKDGISQYHIFNYFLKHKNLVTDNLKDIFKSKFDSLPSQEDKLICAILINLEDYYFKALKSYDDKREHIPNYYMSELFKNAIINNFDDALNYIIDKYKDTYYWYSEKYDFIGQLFKNNKTSQIIKLIDVDIKDNKENADNLLRKTFEYDNVEVLKYMLKNGYKLKLGDDIERYADFYNATNIKNYLSGNIRNK